MDERQAVIKEMEQKLASVQSDLSANREDMKQALAQKESDLEFAMSDVESKSAELTRKTQETSEMQGKLTNAWAQIATITA